MTELYQLMITGTDVRESGMFLAKALKRRHKKGVDNKQAFFVVLSAFTIALAEAMRQAKFDEQEMASIMHQAVDGGLNAQDVSVN